MSTGLLVRIVFGLLVVATTGAFFITQRLKRSPPPIERVAYGDVFSPNGDGRRDIIRIGFTLRRADRISASIVDEQGEEVRRLVDGRRLARGRQRLRWNGRDDQGRAVPDGPYRLRVALRSQGRALTVPRTMRVDTLPPAPRLLAAAPSTLVPGAARDGAGVRVRYRAPRASTAPVFRVYRTDRGRPRAVDRFEGRRLAGAARWDARLGNRSAPDGIYAFTVTVRDKAGNAGTGPAPGLPGPEEAPRGTGVTVVRASLSGPLEPVTAGRVARLRLSGPGRPFRWTLRRPGGARPVQRGRGAGERVRVRVPRRARTGLFLVRVATPQGRAAFPLAVRRPGITRRPLVVLPGATWQGANPVDDDRDGFADTLHGTAAVPIGRPLAGGRLPAGLPDGAGPVLRALDDARARYDLTTDVALARRRGPGLAGRPGVLFPAEERWVPRALDRRLRRYAEQGGRVAFYGTDTFHRRLTVTGERLTEPSAPAPANLFGERTAVTDVEDGPLTVFSDRIGLFRGSGGSLGRVTRIAESRALPPGARLLAAAGREPARPALVAYRLGRGTVVRMGTPAFGRAAVEDAEIARLGRAVWDLLAG